MLFLTSSQLAQPVTVELSETKVARVHGAIGICLPDGLPLTPNGKVDRDALPAPDQSRPELETAYIAPRTRTEELLAEVWVELLKLEKVGIHDNFFELGGHSLLATQVISRLRRAFGVDLPLRSLFETPTIADWRS